MQHNPLNKMQQSRQRVCSHRFKNHKILQVILLQLPGLGARGRH